MLIEMICAYDMIIYHAFMDISDSRNRNLIIINHENWIQKKI